MTQRISGPTLFSGTLAQNAANPTQTIIPFGTSAIFIYNFRLRKSSIFSLLLTRGTRDTLKKAPSASSFPDTTLNSTVKPPHIRDRVHRGWANVVFLLTGKPD